jgi:catechol 2,3-dioxygenase-like lactoylglutathione lyase family enzyme
MSILIDRLDHTVLTVRDIDATCDFYSRVLGMEAISFGKGRRAIRFGKQKFNLHQAGREFEPRARKPTPGSADFCLVTTTPMARVIAHLKQCGVEILEGPVVKTGAIGPIESVYFRDPDENLVEVSRYRDG